ncbi:Uncharacterized protein TCM_028409 [Theobroma cacao]|uniref:Uncharacterized protein n=1 Tax=Theobroma cacao TaxID=3641 RepID=A0A061GBR3_THECC|nr:Uncharacterized protein TCM_028409 [Theobroma cacao]
MSDTIVTRQVLAFANGCVKEVKEFDSFVVPKRTRMFDFVLSKVNNITAAMSISREEIELREYDNIDTLLVVSKDKWAFKVSINTDFLSTRGDSYFLKISFPIRSEGRCLPTYMQMLLAHETLETTPDEARREYWVDIEGGASSHHDGEHSHDAVDGQDDEPSVDSENIDHGIVGAEGDNVTHVDDVVDDVVARDVILESVDVEGDHLPQADVVVEAAAEGNGNLESVQAEGNHDF